MTTGRHHPSLPPIKLRKRDGSKYKHLRIWLYSSLSVVGVTAGLVSYWSIIHERVLQVPISTFGDLHTTYEKGGIQNYIKTKQALKQTVRETMKGGKSNQAILAATNIAVYLFPELLPDEDFEKQVAIEQWAPQQKAIEENPHSPKSRQHFEEIRANIWNYESPDRENPEISEQAKQVIRIYDKLSSP